MAPLDSPVQSAWFQLLHLCYDMLVSTFAFKFNLRLYSSARGVGGSGSLVGHHVRLDAAVTQHTRLTFMTAGILLRRLHGEPLLTGVSHVVLDEIHERSLDGTASHSPYLTTSHINLSR